MTDVRVRLNRERVMSAAVELADEIGIEGLSMRRLAQHLGVVPMALYKHVANKEELLDGMVDLLIGEIDPPLDDPDWKTVVRARVLSARDALLRHPWARRVLESRTGTTPTVLAYMDSFISMFQTGGFPIELTHHVMHAIGSRMWGFTQELFEGGNPSAPPQPEPGPEELAAMAQLYPNIAAVLIVASHEDESVVGSGCDDQYEFEFALDLLLDGIERLRARYPA